MCFGWAGCKKLTTAEVGHVSEELAVRLLVKHGVKVLGRNLKVDKGEIDILAVINGIRSVVEVRSVRQRKSDWETQSIDPLTAFDETKSRQVWYLAGRVGASRVDLVSVSFSEAGVDLHWVPWAG